ncbi:MAG: mechanosensitive ion channel family protein [Nanoarchaeota archaeon]
MDISWSSHSTIIIQIVLLVLLYFVLSALARRGVKRLARKKAEATEKKNGFFESFEVSARNLERAMKISETRHRLISHLMQGFIFLIIVGVIIYLVPPLRTLSYSMLAGAGIAAIILGFAVQKSIANLFAGIFIAIYEPFRIGDFIQYKEYLGVVEDINLHYTVIREWKNRRFIVPNSLISEDLIKNYTITSATEFKTFNVGISYDSDIEHARRIILEEVHKHELLYIPESHVNGTVVREEPLVQVVGWGDFSVDLRIGFWVRHPFSGYKMKFDLLESILKRFKKEGVEVPYPYRTIVYKKDLKHPLSDIDDFQESYRKHTTQKKRKRHKK